MNEHQQRALWGTALRALAESIENGLDHMPHSAHLWTHDLDPNTLLQVADGSTVTPRPVKSRRTCAEVTIPVGERLGLGIDWTYLAEHPHDVEPRLQAQEAYRLHNEHCVTDDRTPPPADHHTTHDVQLILVDTDPIPEPR
jgi:hypothetical protein